MGELSDVGHYLNRVYAKNFTVLLKVLQLEMTGKTENKSEMPALIYFSRLFDLTADMFFALWFIYCLAETHLCKVLPHILHLEEQSSRYNEFYFY